MSVIIDSDNNNVNITEEPINVTVSLGGPDVAAVWGGITGDITEQQDLQTALDGKVPYTGATGNVDLGEYELKAGQIELDTTPTGTAGVAVTRWNDTVGTIETTLKGGNVVLKHGRDMFERVVNKTGVQLTRGAYQAVRISTAQGQRLGVALARANNDMNSADTIGLAVETIDNNQEGIIYTIGEIDGINTTGSLQGETWADGDVLYLSPDVAGRITNVKPVAPEHLVVIGYVVYAHANNGKIYVKVMNGWELGELHDVDTTGATNGQVLTYNGSIWTPATNGSGTVTSIATNAPLTGGTITSSGTIGITQAGAATDGYLSSVDWSTFNNKQAALSLTTTGTSGAATLVGSTLNIPQYQAALTNPVTGTGTAGQVAYWSGTNTQTGSQDFTWNDTTKILSFSNGGTLINEIRVGSINSNTIIGRAAGSSASLSGGSNSFFGQNSGSANTTGSNNSFFGATSGQNNTTGVQNSFFGFRASLGNTTGSANVSFGFAAAQFNTTGNNNVFIARDAGRLIADGSNLTVANNSVYIGYDTRAAADSQTNQIAIGYQAIGLGSNTTVIGNSSTTQTWLGGNLTLGTTTSGGRLTVRGSGTTSATTALLVQNSTPSELFKVTDDGTVTVANNNILTNGILAVGGTISIRSNLAAIPGVYTVLDNNGVNITTTSGVTSSVRITNTYAPTSGTGVFNRLTIDGTINQTGGANGITRGLYVNPTLTAAADWRSVEFSNNTGWGIYGAGTAANYLAGNTSIGTTTSSGRVTIQGSGTTSATKALVVNNATPTALFEILDNGRINQTIPGASSNTLFGTQAGESASLSGNANSFYGASAGRANSTGSDNTAIGFFCLRNNQTGSLNVGVGRSTLSNTTSSNNTAVGGYACLTQTSGASNTAVGVQALYSNTTGDNNTAIGRDSLYSVVGSQNIGVGRDSGRYLANGTTALSIANTSIFIGNDTRANADSETNQIIIGYQAIGNGSNTATLGNTSITNTYLRGNINYTDGGNFVFGTTTGTKIGTSTSQKIGLWNATPIVQPTTAVSAATRVGGGGTTLTDTDTFDGYTIAQIVKALRNIGILA